MNLFVPAEEMGHWRSKRGTCRCTIWRRATQHQGVLSFDVRKKWLRASVSPFVFKPESRHECCHGSRSVISVSCRPHPFSFFSPGPSACVQNGGHRCARLLRRFRQTAVVNRLRAHAARSRLAAPRSVSKVYRLVRRTGSWQVVVRLVTGLLRRVHKPYPPYTQASLRGGGVVWAKLGGGAVRSEFVLLPPTTLRLLRASPCPRMIASWLYKKRRLARRCLRIRVSVPTGESGYWRKSPLRFHLSVVSWQRPVKLTSSRRRRRLSPFVRLVGPPDVRRQV